MCVRVIRVAAAFTAIALTLVGCIEPQLVPCGDQLCPAGKTCVAGEVCASADQIAACSGLTDGETCSFGGGVGRCEQGVCTASSCGNSVIEIDEVCDDGNATSGDGCRSDCRKVEMCGDAVVDDGEGCDDGNGNAADGCDACVPTVWRATALIGGNTAATAVGLFAPSGIAVDRRGNLYVADKSNHRIRRIDTNGVITTVAGVGTEGIAGDGGPATSAQLKSPDAVAVDGLDNVYVVEHYTNRIRRIDPSGVITTVAGTGVGGYTGDGMAATSATLRSPMSVAIDGLGNMYIADSANYRIRRVDPNGIITTFAGTGVQGSSGDGGPATAANLSFPTGVAIDDAGNVFIADGFTIRKINASGTITRVAGAYPGYAGDGGPAISAWMKPSAVAVDRTGNLYISEATNHVIRRVDGAGIITTVAGTGTIYGFSGDGGPATSAVLNSPDGVAVSDLGELFIADQTNDRIRRVDAVGVIETFAGSGVSISGSDGGAATSASLSAPWDVAVDGAGNLYIADTEIHCIRRVAASGAMTIVAGTGFLGSSGDGGPATAARFNYPYGVAVDGGGNIYVADTYNHRIRKIDANGIITTVAGTGTSGFSGDGGAATAAQISYPEGLAIDGAGTLFFADSNNHRIRRIDAAGVITTVAGTGTSGYAGDGAAAISAQIYYPNDVIVAGAALYIADTNNNVIRKVDAAGIITTVVGDGTYGFLGDGGAATTAQLAYPNSVAIDSAGRLYINDRDNGRIRRVDTAGTITTLVGGDPSGDEGDGGPSTSALLDYATSLAVDTHDNLYISDWGNSRIRRVETTGRITTVAGSVDPEGMGPLGVAHLADARALVTATDFTLFAGGSSGTVQATRAGSQWLGVVAGRYKHFIATGALARFRDPSFGTVGGVAYDAVAGVIYLTESNAHRLYAVTMVNRADENTWTIAPLANTSGTAGFADGAAATARFRTPTGLYLDTAAHQLYVADTGNHVVRAIDLSSGTATATVRTVAGTPVTRGYFGDGGAALDALMYEPRAITRCGNGDLFVADTGNNRVRRIAASGQITTVLGVGVAASSGDGRPASTFPVNAPLGLACDTFGNLYVTSTTTVRLVTADSMGVIDGSGTVQTIYGAPPRDTFPASVTRCLTGLSVVDPTTVQIVDSCTGLLVELRRGARSP